MPAHPCPPGGIERHRRVPIVSALGRDTDLGPPSRAVEATHEDSAFACPPSLPHEREFAVADGEPRVRIGKRIGGQALHRSPKLAGGVEPARDQVPVAGFLAGPHDPDPPRRIDAGLRHPVVSGTPRRPLERFPFPVAEAAKAYLIHVAVVAEPREPQRSVRRRGERWPVVLAILVAGAGLGAHQRRYPTRQPGRGCRPESKLDRRLHQYRSFRANWKTRGWLPITLTTAN
jgi:hypothetical protein